mgnify:CR=1 FL=1
MNIITQIKQYANEDADSVINKLNELGFNASIRKIDVASDQIDTKEFWVTCVVWTVVKGRKSAFILKYSYDTDDNIYMISDLTKVIDNQVNKWSKTPVKASTAIMAADGDDFFDNEDMPGSFGGAEPSDNSVGDEIDNLADSVDELQDSIDDVKQDQTELEIDNNIANHYICECDQCHNIFISAIIESDQEIDHITGVCPVCEKESEQRIKWIIRDINDQDNQVK